MTGGFAQRNVPRHDGIKYDVTEEVSYFLVNFACQF
jgi:hypothetical protein